MSLIADDIFSKKIPDMNWLTKLDHPLKRSIGFSLKHSARFVPGFFCINRQIPLNQRNLMISVSLPLIIILSPQEKVHRKKIKQEQETCCEVSQDTEALFVHTINLFRIYLTACCPPMVNKTLFQSLFI